ncbi:hypothetical protein B7494_g7186 [Chlorociboria aeruginascens]|nr:hypothetical protein B7494_g7186 [Chlorociboria aeruginascens]
MNSSLEIITDQNGYFRHPDGYPLVVIFDSQHDTPPPNNARTDTQPLKFVNTSRPKKHGRRTKRFARSHVTEDPPRLNRDSESSVRKSTQDAILCKQPLQSNPEVSASEGMYILQQPFSCLDPFDTFPVKMEPYMYTFIYRYRSLLYNLAELGCGQRVAGQGWLPLAMTDPALFHSILCGSALFQDLLTGRKQSLERFKHMKEAVHLLNTRLQDPNCQVSDGTIVTVAHLAEYESIEGNFENWRRHMDGINQMVQMRGGLAALNDDVRNKVSRADIIGCIGTLSKPRFTCIDIPRPSLSSSFVEDDSALCDGLRDIVDIFHFRDNLVTILYLLQQFTSTLNETAIDLLTLDSIICSTQHRLLLFHSSCFQMSGNSILQETCCIAALVYVQTIIHFHLCLQVGRFPTSAVTNGAVTNGAMIHKLKSCLETADMKIAQARPLSLWVLFLGGVAAAGSKDRTWFVARLVKMVMKLGISSWEEAKRTLLPKHELRSVRSVPGIYRRIEDQDMQYMSVCEESQRAGMP